MGKRVLLVEGNDDKHVMLNLLEVRQIPERFEIATPSGNPHGDEMLMNTETRK